MRSNLGMTDINVRVRPRAYMVLVLALFLLVPFMSPGVASAHARVASSTPASGATVAVGLTQMEIIFTEEISLTRSFAQVVRDRDGVALQATFAVDRANRKRMTISVAALSEGAYTIKWRAVTEDDNGITNGDIKFTVSASACMQFRETGKQVCGRFAQYWSQNGGLAQQGFPISEEMRERSDTDGKEYTVQYFERSVFELHPENKPPYDVLLSLLGSMRLRDRYPLGVPGSSQTLRAQGAITSCTLTHADEGSPTYKPDMPVRSSVGKGHVLTGYVLSSVGCAPIAGARLEMWPDIAGRGHPDEYRATLFTDKDGRYTFESPMSDHIHMRISAHGYRAIFSNAYHSEGRAQGTFNVTLAPDPNCRLYPETGWSVCGAFLDYWQRNGGLAQQGYPISGEFEEVSALDGKRYTVQYFERAVFEQHPENKAPYDVLLSQLGTFRHRAKYQTGNLTLEQFYEKVFYDLGLRDPENFTAIGLPRSVRPDFRNDSLTDVSDACLPGTYDLERKYLQQLAAYDPRKQTPKQLISTATLTWYLTDHTQGEEFMYHDYTLNSVYGVHIALHDLMVEYQPLTSAEDAKVYVVRLNAFPARIDGVLAQMRLREQKGIFMPGWMIDRVVGQLRGMSPTD